MTLMSAEEVSPVNSVGPGEIGTASVLKIVTRIPCERTETNMADVRSKELKKEPIQKMDEDERRDYLDVYYHRGKLQFINMQCAFNNIRLGKKLE